MKIREVMETRFVAAEADATCASLAQRMVAGLVSGVTVTDDQGQVIGVVTEHDILKALLDRDDGLFTAAKEIMRPQPICLDADAAVDQAIDLMNGHGILPIPVTSQGRLVGTMSRSDVLRAYIAEQSEIFALTPNFDD